MRLDKFLKVAGLIPRRTVAKEACDAGRVLVDGRPARASLEVQPGQRLVIDLGRGVRAVEVLVVPSGNVARAERAALVREVTHPD